MKAFVILSVSISIMLACGKPVENQASQESASSKENSEREMNVAKDGLITIKVSGIPVRVELAETPDEQKQGLMFREHLPENQGMFFVYPYEQTLIFWMRNTHIPLDIAFIDRKGVIVSIQSMEPLNEEKHYVSPVPAQYALEMNRGWFQRNGINVGDHVDF
ncbi:MAG: DUF192 domain-containing protein [Candidatus Marinimicrobia bacterium]|nr:DUF192 domain-containing protein [Candidatus Neomarinimicrobiota bacterium]